MARTILTDKEDSNLDTFKKNADHETHLLDSTTIKVHQNTCGAVGNCLANKQLAKQQGLDK